MKTFKNWLLEQQTTMLNTNTAINNTIKNIQNSSNLKKSKSDVETKKVTGELKKALDLSNQGKINKQDLVRAFSSAAEFFKT